MQIVTEEHIEGVIDAYEIADQLYFEDREALLSFESLSNLLTDEGLNILTDDEYDILWFLATIVYASFKKANPEPLQISMELVSLVEEKNWGEYNELKGNTFNELISPLFDNYEQEELLVFLEDSLESDEDVEITPTGKELIFVTIKTLIDALIAASKN